MWKCFVCCEKLCIFVKSFVYFENVSGGELHKVRRFVECERAIVQNLPCLFLSPSLSLHAIELCMVLALWP